MVDAVLADPFYLPSYGRQVSGALRLTAGRGRIAPLFAVAMRGGAVAIGAEQKVSNVPIPGLHGVLGGPGARAVTRAWSLFLAARAESGRALARLGTGERRWLRKNARAFFFGIKGGRRYRFFTTSTKIHLRFFRLAARVDLVLLARAARLLAEAADVIVHSARHLRHLGGTFRHRHFGVSLVIAGRGADRHSGEGDLVIDVGGDDVYLGRAGGTGGRRVASLVVDLGGDDRYEGKLGSQGAGFLGVGALVDVGGNDQYSCSGFCQGVGFFGSGLLADLGGNDEYRGGHFVQSAAAFGSSLVWDRSGNDRYEGAGMCQAASSTLGVAFLADGGGDDVYRCGRPADRHFTESIGIGQGGAAGVRDYPWKGKPAFYGGVAFLDDAGGNDSFYCPVFCQGGAYFLGAAVLVNSGGDDRFVSSADSQGGSIHLAAGLMIKEGGNDRYDTGWGSLGVGGDRGVGVFIDTGGNDRYRSGGHGIGSARKPKALGLFVDLGGDDTYSMGKMSCGKVQRPSSPTAWPYALFLDLGGADRYSGPGEGLSRGNNKSWSFAKVGFGVDKEVDPRSAESVLFAAFPAKPRTSIPFDPLGGWKGNRSHRPLLELLKPPSRPASRTSPTTKRAGRGARPAALRPVPRMGRVTRLLAELPTAGYDRRRQIYESLDLARFTAVKGWDWSSVAHVLRTPAGAPVDLIGWAALWSRLDRTPGSLPIVAGALKRGSVRSAYARSLLIRMVGAVGGRAAVGVLGDRLLKDPDPGCRMVAGWELAGLGRESAIVVLRRGIEDPAPVVRYGICRGLRDSKIPGALSLVLPLLKDPDLYVRRAAAVAAISLGHRGGIPVLLRTMKVKTLDTGRNYGHNLFATLTLYVGKRVGKPLGLDVAKWWSWWRRKGRKVVLLRRGDQSP